MLITSVLVAMLAMDSAKGFSGGGLPRRCSQYKLPPVSDIKKAAGGTRGTIHGEDFVPEHFSFPLAL